jgi:hypothetical protein
MGGGGRGVDTGHWVLVVRPQISMPLTRSIRIIDKNRKIDITNSRTKIVLLLVCAVDPDPEFLGLVRPEKQF